MKVIYFSNDYCNHDYRFLSSITAYGHEVFHIRLEGVKRQVEDRPIPEGVEIVQWAGGQKEFHWQDVPKYVSSLRQVIKRIQPDIVHAGPIQTCAFIAVLTGFRPTLTMSWGFDLMECIHRGKWWQWVTRYTLKHSTFFTSDAEVTRNTAVEYGMNPDHTIIFPWGVDLERFSPKNERTKQRKNAFTLFCNRSWEPLYGVDVLARAFVRVATTDPNVGLMLLGSGSLAQVLRQIFQRGSVLERVTFAGQISQKELPRFYHMADMYISPSHIDGSSVSLMEALACGLPCLVSDIPANKEWVIEKENGWLFPDGDANALADKILHAIATKQSFPEIGRRARQTAEEKANWPANLQKLMLAYNRAIELTQGG